MRKAKKVTVELNRAEMKAIVTALFSYSVNFLTDDNIYSQLGERMQEIKCLNFPNNSKKAE